MRFKFRLRQAERFAELDETAKKAQIGAVRSEHDRLANVINDVESAMVDTLNRTHGMEVDLKWAVFQSEKLVNDSEKLCVLENNRMDVADKLCQQLSEFGEILMRRKAFENKRRSDHRAFRQSVNRKEQKTLDEIHQWGIRRKTR
jgi:hypothetical protein